MRAPFGGKRKRRATWNESRVALLLYGEIRKGRRTTTKGKRGFVAAAL